MATLSVPRRAGRWLLRLGVVLFGSYVALVLLMMFFENALVFQPTSAADYWISPPSPDVRDVHFQTSAGEEIHGWWLPCPAATGATGATGALLFLHGNAGNLSLRGQTILRLRDTLGLPVLIIDYPGYGKSPGEPSEQGCYRAADAAYDWLVGDRHVSPADLVIFGNSLGGGVATHVASRREHRALVLVKTFTSLPAVAGTLYPWVPARLLMHNRFDSLDRIGSCRRPVFVAHGDADELIPYTLGQQLFAAATEPKEFLTMPGHGHNDALPPEFFTRLRDFLQRHP